LYQRRSRLEKAISPVCVVGLHEPDVTVRQSRRSCLIASGLPKQKVGFDLVGMLPIF
jgi:hypothetical protein